MKFSLARIRLRASLGVYLAEDKVVYSLAEKTPFGRRVAETIEAPTARGQWPDALRNVLQQALTPKSVKRTPIVIGMPTSHSFFATLGGARKGETAEALLASNHCCTAIPAAELCCDMVPVKVNGKVLASVAASRKKDLQALVSEATAQGVRFVRIEPAPLALLRGAHAHKGAKIALRLFARGTELIAMLVDGQHPLLWRIIELPPDSETAGDAIVSMVRTFEAYANQQLGIASLDLIALEGAEDIESVSKQLASEFGTRFTFVKGEGATPQAISRGLALGGLEWDLPTLDLARSLAPPPRLVDLIPRGETAMMGAVVICTGLWLWGSGTVATNNAKRAEEENTKNAILKGSTDEKLKNEKTVLTAEIGAVSKFLVNRIDWTEYMTQLSLRLPDSVRIVSISGDYELTTGSEKSDKKSKKGMVIVFTTKLAKDSAAPPEVDHVLAIVRQTPAIMRDFPEVKLNMLRVNKSMEHRPGKEGTDSASFAVSCMPKGKAAPAKGSGGGMATKADAKSESAKAE